MGRSSRWSSRWPSFRRAASGTFVWATAAFTQASLRLFPLGFDLVRAIRGAVPFSDEGELARAVSGAVPIRVALVLVCCAVFGTLSVLAARTFPFRRRRWLGVAAVYLGSLAVGIGAVLADELLGHPRTLTGRPLVTLPLRGAALSPRRHHSRDVAEIHPSPGDSRSLRIEISPSSLLLGVLVVAVVWLLGRLVPVLVTVAWR